MKAGNQHLTVYGLLESNISSIQICFCAETVITLVHTVHTVHNVLVSVPSEFVYLCAGYLRVSLAIQPCPNQARPNRNPMWSGGGGGRGGRGDEGGERLLLQGHLSRS